MGKPRRACKMCKWYKYAGNSPERRPVRERNLDDVDDLLDEWLDEECEEHNG